MSIFEKYDLVFELSPVPLLLVDPDGVIQLANDELSAMFAYERGALHGQKVEILLPPALRDGHPGLRHAYDRFPAKRQMGQGRELEGLARDGRIIPLELGLQPVEHVGETWVIVTAVDTSARRRGETLAKATLDAAASAMIMVNARGKILSVNRAGLHLFGYDTKDLVGQNIEILLPERVRGHHVAYRNSFFELGTAREMGQGTQIHGRHRDGTEFRLEAALRPVEIGNEKLVLATIVDLSERLAAERAEAAREAAEAQAERLAHLNSELTRYAYSASHDLKAPLSTISGMLSLSITDLENGETEEVIGNLRKLLDLSRRSANKVESMLRMARVGQEPEDREPLDVGAIVTTIWSGLVLNLEVAPELSIHIGHDAPFRSHRQSIESALENLLSNAVRYRDDARPSKIEVSTEIRGDSLEIKVADNGIGVPENEQEAIFGMFHTLTLKSGDGLGLPMVRRIIDNLGGQVSCTSQVGDGAEFLIRLPLDRDQDNDPDDNRR